MCHLANWHRGRGARQFCLYDYFSSNKPSMRTIDIEFTFSIPENVNPAMLYEYLLGCATDYDNSINMECGAVECTPEESDERDRLMEIGMTLEELAHAA